MDERIAKIVSVLSEYEDILSDGYSYYCGEGKVDKVLEDIAKEILSVIDTNTLSKLDSVS